MKPNRKKVAGLLHRFVEAFPLLDDLEWYEDAPLPTGLSCSEPVDSLPQRWKPAQINTPADALCDIRKGRQPLPSLFEQLATSYRWLEVDLGVCRLLANCPANALTPLATEMFNDPILNNTLLPAGFIRFATAPNGCYDPICFELSRMQGYDRPIVRLNHESILTNDNVGETTTVFDSFRELVIAVINSAD